MNAELLLSLHAAGFLITYLLHSTLLLGGVWLLVRFHRRMTAETRSLLWKGALLGGVVTSLAMTLLPLPHFGRQLALSVEAASRATVSPAVDAAPIETSLTPNEALPAVLDAPGHAHVAASTGTSRAADWLSGATAAIWFCRALLVVWLVGAAIGICRIALDWLRLHRLVRRSDSIFVGPVAQASSSLARQIGRKVDIRELDKADDDVGPLATGIFRCRIFVPSALISELDDEQLEALLAHEMAHLARRDPLWALIASLVCGVLFVQPLNFLARRRLLTEAEFLADRRAVALVSNRVGLARCLATLGEWLIDSRRRVAFAPGSAGVGMASYRSSLGRRIEAILAADDRPSRLRFVWPALLAVALIVLPLAAPRATATVQQLPSPVEQNSGDETVIKSLTTAAVLVALAAPAVVEESAAQEEKQIKIEAVPQTMHGFSGQIVGKLMSKDVEKGAIVLHVQRVQRVWKNNKAERPKDCEGKTVALDGLFGKFLDVLYTVQPGDTVQIEAKHTSGDNLKFLGEQFMKVAPIADEPKEQPDKEPETAEETSSAGDGQDGAFPEGLKGFRGILVGTVVSTDVEKGVLVFKGESVQRTWPKNAAKNPASAKGKTLTVEGIAGKWLDTLLSFKPGDRIEVEAFHNGGEKLDFVQEWLKKAEQ